jgi:hypothetical protein
MSQREQATERMIQGTSRKQLTSRDGYHHATRQSSESCLNNEVRVSRDSVVFVHTRRFFDLGQKPEKVVFMNKHSSSRVGYGFTF